MLKIRENFNDGAAIGFAKATLDIHNLHPENPLALQKSIIRSSRFWSVIYGGISLAFLTCAASNFMADEKSPVKGSFQAAAALGLFLVAHSRLNSIKADKFILSAMEQKGPQRVLFQLNEANEGRLHKDLRPLRHLV